MGSNGPRMNPAMPNFPQGPHTMANPYPPSGLPYHPPQHLQPPPYMGYEPIVPEPPPQTSSYPYSGPFSSFPSLPGGGGGGGGPGGLSSAPFAPPLQGSGGLGGPMQRGQGGGGAVVSGPMGRGPGPGPLVMDGSSSRKRGPIEDMSSADGIAGKGGWGTFVTVSMWHATA